MIAILSPAKTLDLTPVNIENEFSTPKFLNEAEIIMQELKKLQVHDICTLMKVNEQLGVSTFIRNQEWERFDGINEKPCVLSFKGEAYRGLNANEFTKEDLEFCNEHLRILSGLYGILKPLDGIKPYRLEMGTKISIDNKKDLYNFWRIILSEEIENQVKQQEEKVLLNLASEEYFKVLDTKHKLRVVTPVFKERKGFDYKNITVYAKKARGLMINYIVKNRIDNVEKIKQFNLEGYIFNEELSKGDNWVFTRE